MKPIFDCIIALITSFVLGVGVYFLGTWLSGQKPDLYEHFTKACCYGLVWGIGFNGINLIIDVVCHRPPENHLMLLLIIFAFSGGSYLAGRIPGAKRH